MGYLQEIDRWLDVIFADLANGKMSYADTKHDIRERILDSYRNGLAAGGRSPASHRSGSRRAERPAHAV